jgi:hypothetical protein
MKQEKLSEQVRSAIDGSGMSRYRICALVRLDKSVMSRFMAGTCGLSMATLDALGDLLRLQIVRADAEMRPVSVKREKKRKLTSRR